MARGRLGQSRIYSYEWRHALAKESLTLRSQSPQQIWTRINVSATSESPVSTNEDQSPLASVPKYLEMCASRHHLMWEVHW
jgi:hypothetical protein